MDGLTADIIRHLDTTDYVDGLYMFFVNALERSWTA